MRRREWLRIGLTVAVLTAGLGIGIWSADAARLPAEVAVVDAECDDGAVQALDLRVTLRGDDPVVVTAHVWSSQSHVQLAWIPERLRLTPGTQVVQLRPPRARAEIGGGHAQVALYAGQRRAIRNFRTPECAAE